MKLSLVALLMMVAAIWEPSVSNPMPQSASASAGYAYQRNNPQSAGYSFQRNNPQSAGYSFENNDPRATNPIQKSDSYPQPGTNYDINSVSNPMQKSLRYNLQNDPRVTYGNNPYGPHPQYSPTRVRQDGRHSAPVRQDGGQSAPVRQDGGQSAPVRQDGRQRNMAPSKGPPKMSVGTFTGKQSGNAFSQGETITDSRTQGTRSQMQGGMVGSGKLQGTAQTKSSNGNNAQSGYTGELEGQGIMSTDTQSYSDGRGAGSRTAVKGQLMGEGTISGGSSAGSSGGYDDAFWKKK